MAVVFVEKNDKQEVLLVTSPPMSVRFDNSRYPLPSSSCMTTWTPLNAVISYAAIWNGGTVMSVVSSVRLRW